ncbi:SDR family NAD(P)-dependent oxidoreductase [Psychromonas marina]|nr:SDR family oxidoreductase [Psychromonas marina]
MKNTVLITGASAGLGEEFAWQLAEQGFNLLLVARRTERLSTVQRNISIKYPSVSCLVLSVDLNEADALATLVNFVSLQKIELTGLINNAGFGIRGEFYALPANRQRELLQVNINALTMLSHAFIPHLTATSIAVHNNKIPHSQGVQAVPFIINVASTAAFQAGPNLALYYASKAFVLSFSEALHEELKGKIQVSALCPGATKTEFAEVARMSNSLVFKLRVMDKKAVVSYALKKRGKAIVIPGLMNKIGVIAVKLLPRFITRKLAYQIQK